MMVVVGFIAALVIAGYWAGPMNRDDGWPEPVVRQKLADKKAHAERIDPGVKDIELIAEKQRVEVQ